jgi:hypothetical protein
MAPLLGRTELICVPTWLFGADPLRNILQNHRKNSPANANPPEARVSLENLASIPLFVLAAGRKGTVFFDAREIVMNRIV